MKFYETEICGVYVIELNLFKDERGFFVKTFNEDVFKDTMMLSLNVKESFYSISKKNVIRGMHFQTPPYDNKKLVYVASGKIKDVVLDIRRNSPSFGKHLLFEMAEVKPLAIYIPAGCAHGFLSQEDNSIAVYMQTTVYSADHDKGILWSSFGLNWGISDPVISQRDNSFPRLDEFESPFA